MTAVVVDDVATKAATTTALDSAASDETSV